MEGFIRPGSRVQVLPGRNFPSFSAGDTGVVHRIDDEARTCDVLFDGRSGAGPTPVAIRHLGLSGESETFFSCDNKATVHRSSAFVESVFERNSKDWAEDFRERIAGLESQLHSQQSAWAALERRVSACESTVAVGESISSSSRPAGRMVAARVAGIESAQQAEVEQRSGLLQKATRELESELEKLSGMLSSHERRAVDLKEVVAGAGSGLTRLGSLLEGQERRTLDLGQALSKAEDDLAHLNGSLEESTRRLADRRRHLDPVHNETESNGLLALRSISHERPSMMSDPDEKDKIWNALRELQELVVHESENRAAGLREVLAVLDQGTGQMRTEQVRLRSDLEGLCKAESRKIKQHTTEMQTRFFEVDQSVTRLDERLDDLTNSLAQERNSRAEAVTWLTGQLQEVSAGRQPQSSPFLLSADAASSRELLALKGVELVKQVANSEFRDFEAPGRFPAAFRESDDRQRALKPRDTSRDHVLSATEDTLGKLRGQLEGLRCELQGPAEVREQPALGDKAGIDLLWSRDSVEIPSLSPSLWKEPTERQSILCHNCGNNNLPDANFCRVCGLKYESGASIRTLSPRRVVHTISEATQSLQPRVIYDSMSLSARPTVVAPSQQAPSPRLEHGLDINSGGKTELAVTGPAAQHQAPQQTMSRMAASSQGARVTLHTGPAKGYSRPSEYQTCEPEDNEDTS
eukprot:TRINITY_DN12833_c0_g1_i1.p1 TRINITY_DN12833_c0_g1~~TRINITY_DN12833_c0_g1_i1.p1  ORF type:complete len:694 (-),score=109.17 TRINITY_DN12833_c0_g1_i1:137-2218(-)